MKYGQVKSAKLQLNSEIHVIHSPRSPRQRTQHPCVRNLRRWLLSHRSHDPQSTAHGQIDQGSCCGSRDISSYLFWCVKISSHLFWFVYVGVCYLMLLDVTWCYLILLVCQWPFFGSKLTEFVHIQTSQVSLCFVIATVIFQHCIVTACVNQSIVEQLLLYPFLPPAHWWQHQPAILEACLLFSNVFVNCLRWVVWSLHYMQPETQFCIRYTDCTPVVLVGGNSNSSMIGYTYTRNIDNIEHTLQ
jgi:hypothetical protein